VFEQNYLFFQLERFFFEQLDIPFFYEDIGDLCRIEVFCWKAVINIFHSQLKACTADFGGRGTNNRTLRILLAGKYERFNDGIGILYHLMKGFDNKSIFNR
jgi:hypothetical protein